ncbi:MAG: hypothetical protein CVU06_04620 [Bacteroidetes bacterium HGW-Bacteroidetes-22]|nr:MAG: hypothetical protein CVU06_04620 [Bacteroidetes bacterium HGW-Bacteroidetes-22]
MKTNIHFNKRSIKIYQTMKNILRLIALFMLGCNASGHASVMMPGQDSCNVVVINDTEEQNGLFITGNSGQKAAVDIPIASDIQMTITGIKVTLSSKIPPTYVHFRFYNDTLTNPEDPGEIPQEIPGDILFDVTATEIDTFIVVGYEPMHQFYVRNLTITLPEPIVLKGNLVQGRYWMGVIADANAWASTAHFETGAGVVGESVVMGGDNFEWFQMINLEGLYELTADCSAFVSVQDPIVNKGISIYPNPAGDYISVNHDSGETLKRAELYNLSGQKVRAFDSDFNNLDLSGLNDGVYMLRVFDAANNVVNKKIIKATR